MLKRNAWLGMGAFALLALTGQAGAQVDFTGDGNFEIAFCEIGSGERANGEIVVHHGSTGNVMWSHSGAPGSLLGWAATAHPDIDGDGLADVLVTAPGAGAEGPGEVRALRGLDGTLLWSTTYGLASAKFGLGVGVVPDQNADGVPDVVVAMLSDDYPGDTAVLLDGVTGAVLARAPGPVAAVLAGSRAGTFKFKSADLDGSGVVDEMDGVAIVLAIGTSTESADLNFSSTVDCADLDIVMNEMTGAGAPAPTRLDLLLLVDPLLYNEGFTWTLEGDPPPGVPAPRFRIPHQCASLADAYREALQNYYHHMHAIPLPPLTSNPWDNARYLLALWAWEERRQTLQERMNAASAALNACLASVGLPPAKPHEVRPPNIDRDPPVLPPSPPPAPLPVPPDNECLLDASYPPQPPSPGAPQDACYNQLETNIIVCGVCHRNSMSNESYARCLERAKQIYRTCKRAVANP